MLNKAHARCLVDRQQQWDPPALPQGKAVGCQDAPSCRLAIDLVLLPESRCYLCCWTKFSSAANSSQCCLLVGIQPYEGSYRVAWHSCPWDRPLHNQLRRVIAQHLKNAANLNEITEKLRDVDSSHAEFGAFMVDFVSAPRMQTPHISECSSSRSS